MKERSQRRRPVPQSAKMSSSEFQPKEQRRYFVWSLSEGGVNPSPTARELVGTRS